VNTLPAEFRRLQITAQDGWLDPAYCREELAVIVAETVGWVHSETFQKIADRIQDIGRISGSVISKL
jgi:malonyl CoA-acyl carrier protein transacylase